MLDSLLDWAAEKVQNFTGESDRRRLVEQFKLVHIEFQNIITEIVEKINIAIGIFNEKIDELNSYRQNKVKKNIFILGVFLSQFGKLREVGDYADEDKHSEIDVPKKQFQQSEDFIKDIDWSKDDVFEKTFFKSIFGVRAETRKINQETTQKIEEFKMECEEMVRLAENKNDFINQDIMIADMYSDCVKSISNTIEEKVLPELELVQAFLQCDEIKNNLLANKEVEIKKENDITLLAGSMYDKHYQFIKNTFMFFIISSKIYNTQVLTNLLNDGKHDEEEKIVRGYTEILEEHQNKLEQYSMK